MNGAKERVQQKDKSLQSSASETTGMNRLTWLYLAVASAVFGYWQNNIAAGIFVFLFLVLLTRLLYMVVNKIVGVRAGVARVETLLSERLEDPTGGCTGYKDCPCWWHTEERALAEKSASK